MTALTSQLLDEFESSVKKEFHAFIEVYGARYESGFSQFEGTPTKLKKRGNNIPGLFWFICRFQFEEVVLDIGFGDKEFIVEPMLFYPKIGLTFHPTFLVEAAGRNKEKGIGGNAFVLEPDFMRRTIKELSTALANTWDILKSPSQEIFDRAQALLGRKMIFDQKEQKRKDMNRDTIIASKAFHEGEYEKAKSLLSPYTEDPGLPKASRKILELIEKHKNKKGEQFH